MTNGVAKAPPSSPFYRRLGDFVAKRIGIDAAREVPARPQLYNRLMPSQWKRLLLILCLVVCANAHAGFEIFGKGSISKNYVDQDDSTVEIDISGGFATTLFTGVRLEARYTNVSTLQSRLDVVTSTAIGSLTNITTENQIYSLGLDIDFLGQKSTFQPYIYVGAGYMISSQNYYFTPAGSSVSTYVTTPATGGITANGGLGFRLMLTKSLALEFEMFAYALGVTQPGVLINYFASAGLRIFI